jgi:hypothetical protein
LGLLPLFEVGDARLSGSTTRGRVVRFLAGLGLAVLAASTLVLSSDLARWFVLAAIVLIVIGLAASQALRRRRVSTMDAFVRPDAALLWTVMPVALAALVAGLAINLSSLEPLADERAFEILIRAAADEFVFLGVLLLLAFRLLRSPWAQVTVSLLFASWYLPACWSASDDLDVTSQRVTYSAVCMVGVFAGGLTLVRLRLQARSIFGSIAAHASAVATAAILAA